MCMQKHHLDAMSFKLSANSETLLLDRKATQEISAYECG